MPEKTDSRQPQFGISTVSQLTGISKPLLRIWEQRYKILEVCRSDTGRRLYSQADVERLLLIKYLVDRGESIGKVARMSNAELQETSNTLSEQSESQARLRNAGTLSVAVLGDYLPAQLKSGPPVPERLKFVACSSSIPNFRADIRRLKPDALVIEQAVFNRDSEKFLAELAKESNARIQVVVYGFGRREELEQQRSRGIRTVRSPCSLDQLYEALLKDPLPPQRKVPDGASKSDTIPQDLADVPDRRFEVQDLARLANASSTVECECPNHLVDLVINLNAFEAYSAACENRNAADAALHAYLHATTARVRAQLEEALERVARMEGLL